MLTEDELLRWRPDGPDLPPPPPECVVVNMSDVEPREIEWLWPNRIPLGKLTGINGNPGLGKSFLTLDLAARTTTGARWPDGSGNAPLGSVVILTAEDDLGDTVRPRLDAAGADVSKIIAIEAVRGHNESGQYDRLFDVSRDMDELHSVLSALIDCKLVIIDPISAYLGKTKSHDNAEVRGVLAPLSALAAEFGVAMIVVSHFRKGEGSAINATMGSMAFVAAVRGAYAVTKDPNDPTNQRRLFLPIKNNIGNDRTGLAYSLSTRRESGGIPFCLWEAEPVTTTADEALSLPLNKRGPAPDERNQAADYLLAALTDGPRPAREMYEAAEQMHGIKKRTLDRAKRDLKIEAFRVTVPGRWLWRLPVRKIADNIPTNANTGRHGNLDNLGVFAEESDDSPTQHGQGCHVKRNGEALGNLDDINALLAENEGF
ncbi:MAG TPA: AAA family ATPase [Pirellulales bacterium]